MIKDIESTLSIVIADDDEVLTGCMKERIETDPRNKVVGIANNDGEEIKLIETLQPDVVITDLLREDNFTGLDVIKEYKDKENKPIFFVVSRVTCLMINQLRANGIEYYLDRPFMYEELMTKLANIYYRKYYSTDKNRRL